MPNISNLIKKISEKISNIASEIDTKLSGKANSSHTHDDRYYTESEIDTKLSGKSDTTHNHNSAYLGITAKAESAKSADSVAWNNVSGKPSSFTPASHTHTKSQITDFPTIPTVNNATLKIQKNGTDVKTFTANASSDVTCNITVPTKVSELSNDSGFLTSHQSLSNYSTLANTVKSLSISGKTITVTPGSGNAYTLTTQDTVYTHPTSSGNKHIPSGGSSGQFLGWSADGTAKWVNNPNTNTDTLMTQNVSTTNATYPVLLVAAADATANQGAKTGIFAKSVKVNPSTNVISASGFVGPLTGNVTGNCSGTAGGVAWSNVSGKPSSFTPSSHTHDDRYYTESEINTKLSGKYNTSELGSTTFKVTRGASISTSTTGYWSAMCHSAQTGSPTLPTSGKWWHVISMDWGNDAKNWVSQLAIATQETEGVYWRKNNAGGTDISSSTWYRLIDSTNIGSQSVNYAKSAGSVAWGNVSGRPDIWIG